MSTVRRAACPECGKTVTVLKAGVLRHHTSRTPEWPGSPFNRACDGSGRAVSPEPPDAGA